MFFGIHMFTFRKLSLVELVFRSKYDGRLHRSGRMPCWTLEMGSIRESYEFPGRVLRGWDVDEEEDLGAVCECEH